MRVLILNSAQSKRIRCNDPWVQSTARAVENFYRQGCTFIVSPGLSAWELTLWKAASLGASLEVICPLGRDESPETARHRLAEDFELGKDSATWHFLRSTRAAGRLKDVWEERDDAAWKMADLVVPVSIRPGGRLGKRLGGAFLEKDRQRLVIDDYRVPYEARSGQIRWESVAFDGWPQGFDTSSGVIIHLTRACSGVWPGERRADRFRALFEGQEGDPRDGFSTLARIVAEGKIRGAAERVRGGWPMVCFAQLNGDDATRLVRWRKRFARHAFEPYAVALSIEAAQRLGARAVEYDGGVGGLNPLEESSPWRQGQGPDGAFLGEKEWRIAGDVDLRTLGAGHLAVMTANETEAAVLRHGCPWPVGHFRCVATTTK